MKETYAKISNQETENASRGRKQYDKKVRSTIIKHEDMVSVRNSFWKDEVYVVLSRKSPDSQKYYIQSESTVRRNFIAICHSRVTIALIAVLAYFVSGVC